MNKTLSISKSELKKIQNTLLEILIEVDRICRKNDIKYFLFAGTLLGAVRHKGFIPWDDDIDIAMPREDYEKFLQIVQKEPYSNYFLQNVITEIEAPFLFSKFRKDDTLLLEKAVMNKNIHHGIFIDIFPLDKVWSENYFKNYNIILLKYLHHLYNGAHRDSIDENEFFLKKIARKTITKLHTEKTSIRFYNIMNRLMTVNNSKRGGAYNHLTNGITKERFKRFIFSTEEVEELIEIEFENHAFLIPKNYDHILKRMYGNYMELPPANERHPHHNIVDLKI